MILIIRCRRESGSCKCRNVRKEMAHGHPRLQVLRLPRRHQLNNNATRASITFAKLIPQNNNGLWKKGKKPATIALKMTSNLISDAVRVKSLNARPVAHIL